MATIAARTQPAASSALVWLGRALAAGGVAAALLLGVARTAHAEPTVVPMRDVAARFGLERVDAHMLSGRLRFSDGKNVVILAPGAFEMLVNGRAVTLSRPTGCLGGDLVVPADALAFLERQLTARPASPPAPAPLPAPIPVQTAPAPRVEALAPTAPAGSRGTIVIDPGHGGKFTGTKGNNGLLEKDVNLAIAHHMREMLTARGWRVVLTRQDDRPLNATLNADLEARAEMANRLRADLFVSVHANHASSSDVRGFEVFHHPQSGASGALAESLRVALKGTGEHDRGVKTAGFRVLRVARMPAVLVEVGFLSHAATETRLRDDAVRRQMAEALVQGIDGYRGRP